MSDHADRSHAFFAPSGSEQWTTCPGGWQEHLLAPDAGSPFAAEGTRAHEIAETWLRDGLADRPFTPVIATDPALLDATRGYVERCLAVRGVECGVEDRVDFSFLTPLPNQRGTADFWSVVKEGGGYVLYLRDLKMGTGVRVYAANNKQLSIYACALLERLNWEYGFTEVRIVIDQPRLDHLDEWVTTPDALREFGEWVKERAALVLSPNAPRVPSEKGCRWCRVKATCAAQLDLLNQVADDTFEVVEPLTPSRALSLPAAPPSLPPIASLTVEQLARIQHHAKTIKSWLDAGQTRLMAEALAGRPVPGWKLVEGRSMRRWRDEHLAGLSLSSNGIDASVTDIISPAEAETRLKAAGMKAKDAKALVAELTVKPPGAPTLVPDSDERPVIDHDDGDVFGVIE